MIVPMPGPTSTSRPCSATGVSTSPTSRSRSTSRSAARRCRATRRQAAQAAAARRCRLAPPSAADPPAPRALRSTSSPAAPPYQERSRGLSWQCDRHVGSPAGNPGRWDRARADPDRPAEGQSAKGQWHHQDQPDRPHRLDRRPVDLRGQAAGHAGPSRRIGRVPGDPVPARRQPGGADQPGPVAAHRAHAGNRRRALGGRTARRRAAHPRHHPPYQRDGGWIDRICAACWTTSPP